MSVGLLSVSLNIRFRRTVYTRAERKWIYTQHHLKKSPSCFQFSGASESMDSQIGLGCEADGTVEGKEMWTRRVGTYLDI